MNKRQEHQNREVARYGECETLEMRQYLPDWSEKCTALLDEIKSRELLQPQLIELIFLIIDVTATHLYAPGVRRRIQNALRLGLSQADILEVFKLASVVGIHSCALGVPILKEELQALGLAEQTQTNAPTPLCDALKENGQFNPQWETLYLWDPSYLENFLQMAMEVWRNNILPPLWIELLCIAGDAAITHLWAPGVKRHMHAALRLGATSEQIMDVLKIVSLQGLQTCELGTLILDEVLKEYAKS